MPAYTNIDSLYGLFGHSAGADRQQYEIVNAAWQKFPPVIQQSLYDLQQAGRLVLSPRWHTGETEFSNLYAMTEHQLEPDGKLGHVTLRVPDITPFHRTHSHDELVHAMFTMLKHEVEHILDIKQDVLLGHVNIRTHHGQPAYEDMYGRISDSIPVTGDIIDRSLSEDGSGYAPHEFRVEAAAYGTQVTPNGTVVSDAKFDHSIPSMVGAATMLVRELNDTPDLPYKNGGDFQQKHPDFVANRVHTAHACCAAIQEALQR